MPGHVEIVEISNRVADEYGIPRLLLLACGVAESNLTNVRFPPDPADDYACWTSPDPFAVSGGVWRQAVRFDPDYRGEERWPGQEEVERVLALQLDVERSARIAARLLRTCYRPSEEDSLFRALCRYDWPSGGGQPSTPDYAARFRRGLAEAERLLPEAGEGAGGRQPPADPRAE